MRLEVVSRTRSNEPWVTLSYPPISAVRGNRKLTVDIGLAGAESMAFVRRQSPERVLEFRPYDYLSERLNKDVDRIPRTVFGEDRPIELRETRREVFEARQNMFNKNINQVIIDGRSPLESVADPLEIDGSVGYDLIIATKINELYDPRELITGSFRSLNKGGLLVYICEDAADNPNDSAAPLYRYASRIFLGDSLHSARFSRVYKEEDRLRLKDYGCFWFEKR